MKANNIIERIKEELAVTIRQTNEFFVAQQDRFGELACELTESNSLLPEQYKAFVGKGVKAATGCRDELLKTAENLRKK